MANVDKTVKICKELTILYVEDDKEAQAATLRLLERMFDHVIVASDGEDGLQKFKDNQNSIDLILADINMPHLNGIEMLEEIRKIDKKVYFIILSAYNELEFFLDSIKLGVDGYILKPIKIKQFMHILSKIVYHIDLEIQKKNSEQMLIEQAKFASMGEMISMIAHQWRQPLTRLSGYGATIKIKKSMGMLKDGDIDEMLEKQDKQISYMTETIEEFLKFFKGDISDVNVTLKQVLDRPHRLMESAFIDYGVEYQYKSSFRDDTELILCESRFNQVLINIYQNSLDAMIESNIKEGKILVSIYEENSKIIFEIKDNAGGIKDDVLPKIFDPYFSTKSKNGTGIGLYMSKLIVENNLLGDIEAFNIDDGVCFKIILPLIK